MGDTSGTGCATRAQIHELLMRDPGLPRQNPTASYWQHVPHALANTSSIELPTEADVVIIGSGITAAAVSKTLLENSEKVRVVVLEARTLCSGATGRNGGQLATNAGEIYATNKKRFGAAMAGKIAKFTFRTCERVKQIIHDYAAEEAEYRDVLKVRTYLDQQSFDAVKDSVQQMEADHPDMVGIYSIISKEVVRQKYGAHHSYGGVTLSAGVLWPYRLVCKIYEALLRAHLGRLSIETNTPATEIDYSANIYSVHTPRGIIKARRIVHCTNGYSASLVPGLRGLLRPWRGTMSVQNLNSSETPKGVSNESFGIHFNSVYDEKLQTVSDGLVYMTQNEKSGYYFIGGDKFTLEQNITTDDSALIPTSIGHLQRVLGYIFDHGEIGDESLVAAWTGVMGMTSDHVPYVGKLPRSLTEHGGPEEWIAAGFNGYGMPYCWCTGEALAAMILGQEAPEWFPEAYLLNEDRLGPERIEKVVDEIATMFGTTV